MTAAIITFIFLLLLGVPIAYVLGIVSVVYMIVSDNALLLMSASQSMFSGTQNFGLLAIPLFVLVGELMNSGGITTRLIHFANVLLGHFRGGLAYVNVAANMFLAAILGSPTAQTAMMSQVMVPAMEKEGYKKEFSAALTISSSLLAPMIPPSLLFIIYGVVAEVSIAQLFLSGILPGIILALGMVALIIMISIKESFPKTERASFEQIYKSFFRVFPALLIPIVILVGILGGIFTVTESSAVAVFVALVVGGFIYRELDFRKIPKMLKNTAINSSIVTFIIAMAELFGYILSYERIPQLISDFFVSISENPIVFLLLINVLFLLVGMVMEGIAALVILIPILLPVAVSYGIDPVHFGVIACLNLIIGLMTPPVGINLFIASSIAKIRMEDVTRAVVPFIVMALVVLMLITFIPSISLWIPETFSK
ncbi:TRAP transporter large permease [Salibacterium salarium]|uniref:TRAP transporter large permease n=1 Tax=Salibacterium salarium TaxID=284579 RepID=A0A428MZ86_9BACI|nr:TRAP transporter large permease [Salibacterium salarium]RSL31461.1 TRAP transporter large permease [Salibacterium salarium]